MSVVPWDVDATVEKMAGFVRDLARSVPWVELVVFHELAAPGVMQFSTPPSPQVLAGVQQSIPGPLSDRLCALARKEKRWLLPGSLYELEDGKLFNTAIVISPAGEIVAKYRKLFPWYPFEAEFTAGDEFCVFDIPGIGRFGLSICYDMWFPETVRTLAWLGAEVVLHPTLTTSGDRELELVLGQSHAITNQCYFVDINGVGPWGGGYSQIIDPDGRVVQRASGQETVVTEILDLDRVTRTRELGTLGMTQSLKNLRDSRVTFPQYGGEFARGEVFKKLKPEGT
ncbi:MAG: Aliphatic amidase AmiE [uncultured Truepera sp.]|uniref:Aliphatic amidase AmiE n=1 Tax=uncultured Truepera sp. TaxID=543023 RepID=A0A6J4UVZ3_9DEIN|nr:MAG: Aliphatic amidase AmiE [uncultured Truepera sp.]